MTETTFRRAFFAGKFVMIEVGRDEFYVLPNPERYDRMKVYRALIIKGKVDLDLWERSQRFEPAPPEREAA